MFTLPTEIQPDMSRIEITTALMDKAIIEGSTNAIVELAVFGDAPFTAQVIADYHAADC